MVAVVVDFSLARLRVPVIGAKNFRMNMSVLNPNSEVMKPSKFKHHDDAYDSVIE
jgi:hypothetical protein